jgi:DNA modification methylase
MESLAKKNYQSELHQIDWDFTGSYNTDGLASYHWYPARFVPQLAGILINYFSEPYEIILDPFCGSGTTLVEAYKFGRLGVGVELNPIGALISKAKLIFFNQRSFSSYYKTILSEARSLKIQTRGSLLRFTHNDVIIPNYKENRFWYHPETLAELACLWNAIHRHQQSKYFAVGCATFSSILKYCCSQDKHWGWVCDNVKPKRMIYKDAMKKFSEKLSQYKSDMTRLQLEISDMQEEKINPSEIKVYQGDCLQILGNFPKQMFDLVITSPPYYNMTDYILSQRLSFLWFKYKGRELLENEIGARHKRFRKNSHDDYLNKMRESFMAIARVLKKGRFCCVVIGESPRHQPYLDQFEKICKELGFKIQQFLSRRISKQRSLSPILHHEKILIMKKV